jgi:biotin synthase-related radical SAM superfamily protein
MFPNNSMGPARVPPTAAEIVAIRARCAAAIVSAVPDVLLKQVFKEAGKKPMSSIEVQAQVEEMLDVFADGYLNKHLIVGIVDLVFARLVPEILHVHGDM